MAEDGCSDAHIVVNKTLSDGVIIEVHIYGQMKESSRSNPLFGFLSNNIFSKHYYFHGETFRSSFRRLVQVHVISSQMGRPGGYEIVGSWMENGSYKMSDLLRNDFDNEKNQLVASLKNEVKNHLLKCEHDSRYAILGFYQKIAATETTLEELVSRILTESDKRICPKSIRNIANNMADLIKIRNEVNEYIKLDKDKSTSAELRSEIENFLHKNYLEWLQEFNKCDPIPSDIGFISLLLIDPNALEMLAHVRERIARVWKLNVNFELNKTFENLIDFKFVTNFQSSWRNFFKSEEYLKQMAGLSNGKFYPNEWSGFEARSEQISNVCSQYIECLDELICILERKRSASFVNKKNRANTFTLFYEIYADLFTYELHLDRDTGLLVDYKQKSQLLVGKLLKSEIVNANLNHIKLSDFRDEFKLTSTTRISFILNLIEFIFSIDDVFEQLDTEAKGLVKRQVQFLIRLQNKPVEVNRVVIFFCS